MWLRKIGNLIGINKNNSSNNKKNNVNNKTKNNKSNNNDSNNKSLFVPKGCANAYLTLEKNTWILYYHSKFYNTKHEASINYNDPYFKFKWPFKPKVISKKDRMNPFFKNL